MTHHIDEVSSYLRTNYFKNQFMALGISQDDFVLSIKNDQYKIPRIPWQQYEELRNYVESTLKQHHPEIFV